MSGHNNSILSYCDMMNQINHNTAGCILRICTKNKHATKTLNVTHNTSLCSAEMY